MASSCPAEFRGLVKSVRLGVNPSLTSQEEDEEVLCGLCAKEGKFTFPAHGFRIAAIWAEFTVIE